MADYAIIKVSTLLEIADAIRTMRETDLEFSPGSMSDEILAIETGADVSGVTATEDDVISGVYFVNSAGELKRGNISRLTLATPTLSIDPATGIVTANVSQSAGYVAASTKSGTLQLTTQAAKTVTPSTSAQTAVSAGTYVTGDVKVGAITTATKAKPVITVGADGKITASYTQSAGYVTAGTVSADAKQLTTKAATTITPGTSEKTAVATNVYTTGAVKVAGDADLVASNIKSGVTIFNVTGTYVPTFT